MSKSKSLIIKNLLLFCKFFDLYGLFIKKKPKFYTTCSGIISICVISIIISTFSSFISSWLNKEKMTIIPSSISYSSVELLARNQNYEYDFNYQNYYIYWVITAILPNGTAMNTQQLKNYYNYAVIYRSVTNVEEVMTTEPCKIDYQDIFLGLDEEKIKNDAGNIAPNRICIKDHFKMGLFLNQNISSVLRPAFYFNIFKCVNSTGNNNSCASQQAIDDIIKYTYVQTSLPLTVYDFNNVKKSQKNVYDYQYTYLDKLMSKYYLYQLTPTLLYIDDGIVSEDYHLQSINFNPNLNYDPSIKNPEDPLLTVAFGLNLNFQIYYLKNMKLNEIAGNLGGLINAIFLVGRLFCLSYNSLVLRFKIIQSTFHRSNLKKERAKILPKEKTDEIGKKSIVSKIVKNFSFLSFLFPSKEVREFYKKGSKNLHEYLDNNKTDRI